MTIQAYTAFEKGGELKETYLELEPLQSEEVLIKVHHCGICHSDLSMLNNDWGITKYPFVPGHEIIGEIVEVGPQAKKVKVNFFL